MTYLHLTIEERICIATLWRNGEKNVQIARILGRNPGTVSREIRRNWSPESVVGPGYYPHTAQRLYQKRKKRCHVIVIPLETKAYLEDKLRLTWSPEQISCAASPFRMPSFKTIYRWIEAGLLCPGDQVLRRKGRKALTRETRGKINFGTPISKRPKDVWNRVDFGHWEADTVVSGRGKVKACLAALSERKSRLYLTRPIPDRTAKSLTFAVVDMLRGFPPDLVKTITCDRGKEFSDYARIETELHCRVYFADPYCAWQKGSVENANGLLREFLPKGSCLRISRARNDRINDLINGRPKKCIGFVSPRSLFNDQIKNCT